MHTEGTAARMTGALFVNLLMLAVGYIAAYPALSLALFLCAFVFFVL
jgi:hypothetical protein